MRGYDCSFSVPDPVGMRVAGYSYALRYCGVGSGKLLSADELAKLRAAAMPLGLLVELDRNDTDQGAALGRSNAMAAIAHTRMLGLDPAAGFRCYSADEFIGSANLAAAIDYFTGVNQVDPYVWAYCGSTLAGALKVRGLARGFIKPAASSWSPTPFPFEVVQGPNGLNAAGGNIDVLTSTTYPTGLYGRPTSGGPHMFLAHEASPTRTHMRLSDGFQYRVIPLDANAENPLTTMFGQPIVVDDIPTLDALTGAAWTAGPVNVGAGPLTVHLDGTATPAA